MFRKAYLCTLELDLSSFQIGDTLWLTIRAERIQNHKQKSVYNPHKNCSYLLIHVPVSLDLDTDVSDCSAQQIPLELEKMTSK